jgi:hypothetical protein
MCKGLRPHLSSSSVELESPSYLSLGAGMVEAPAPTRRLGFCNPHTEDGSLQKLQTYTRLPGCPNDRFPINRAPQRLFAKISRNPPRRHRPHLLKSLSQGNRNDNAARKGCHACCLCPAMPLPSFPSLPSLQPLSPGLPAGRAGRQPSTSPSPSSKARARGVALRCVATRSIGTDELRSSSSAHVIPGMNAVPPLLRCN